MHFIAYYGIYLYGLATGNDQVKDRPIGVGAWGLSKHLQDPLLMSGTTSVEISEDTKQKVQAFAKLYNYRPNNIALSF